MAGGEGLFNSVTSSEGKRWAVALDELVELLPEGRVHPVEKVPSLSQLLIGPEGQRVLCKPADLSMAHSAPAECSSSGPTEWRVNGSWKRSPLQCGEWLVTKEGTEVRVRALSNGKEVARHTSTAEALGCGQRGELLVADKKVHVLALPSLEMLWAAPCGKSPALALVASGDGGACLDAKGSVRRFKDTASNASSRE